LALAHGPWLFALGWALAGVTMSVLLYEGAFAALRERADLDFRRAVATITVVGGLASTVFWPLTRGLVEWVGWRGTAAAFALLHLAVVAPLHAMALRSLRQPARTGPSEPRVEQRASRLGARVRWLAVSFALAAFVSGALAAHLDSLFTDLGVGAVWVMAAAVSFGPLQTAGRVLDLMLDGRWSWRTLGVVLLGVQTLALTSLFALPLAAWLAVPFAASFGAANGLLTLVRPLSVADGRVADGRAADGRADFARALFAVSSASLFARALAPLTVASALRLWGVQGVLIGFVLLSATAWLAFRRALTSST
jgi:predicted MFS family arabinose efflux permease